jgi:hypothetical protein
MKMLKSLAIAAAMIGATAFAAPAMAQDSSYKLGTVWEVGRIDVLPGQAENYMDWLATNWKRNQEALKADGVVVSYHVLSTNNRRADEPDLLLVIQYKDYQTTAQLEATRKRVNALMGQDNRSGATAAGKREAMRVQLGSTEYQELILK